ncbi:MAG: biphenyl 2,3-dioxygenase [Deltaproteobacteria bacterium]|nr:biphenyl 2,3-dioxygenase [Deltaproteobacteria bacterium]
MSTQVRPTARQRGKLAPIRFAHAVLQTNQFSRMLDWYRTVLEADIQYANEWIAFITYDEEHHRLALVARPGTIDKVPNAAGLAHLAYAYTDMDELVTTYERLKTAGIVPVRTINHGPTTSMYYADPDGNQVELQIDNFDTPEECHAWFFRPQFAENPIGLTFDPEELVAKFRAGVPVAHLKQFGSLGMAPKSTGTESAVSK